MTAIAYIPHVMARNSYKSCHITVNRACNARCEFCYAKDTGFDNKDDMTLDTLNNVIKICEDAKIDKIILIGGEPTVYPHIFTALEKIKASNITLVTNGILLKDIDLCRKYMEYGVNSFSVAIKAHNRETYKKITKVDKFEDVLQSISNLKSLSANFSVSYVITNENIDNVLEMIDVAITAGARAFFFSFCRNFNTEGSSNKEFINNNNPIELARKFEKLLPKMKEKQVSFRYAINEPLCIYSKEFLDNNLSDFEKPCYVYNESSLTFDNFGNIIPCNTMYQIKLGLYGKDFVDYESLKKHQQSEQYKLAYRILRGLPDKNCESCEKLRNCFGRCACNWTNYTFTELQAMINSNKT